MNTTTNKAMNKLRYACAIFVATGTISLAALADNAAEQKGEHCSHHQEMRGHDGEWGGHGDHGPFAKAVELTDAQKNTLKADRAANETAARELHQKIRAAHEALEKAAESNASDAELNKLAATSASLIAQEEVNRVKAHRKFMSILTPEQKQKLTQWEADHKGKMKEHDGHMD